MKNIFFLLILFAIKLNAQQKYWQQKTDYNISVTLNDVDHSLKGYEKIDYYNNSPDTLSFIWIHLWPNAYKNDRTAFSDQTLIKGSTKFYFSEEKDRGYINQLSFKVNDVNVFTEDHPQHQDIVKLILPKPLAPSEKITIETPFRVKLPYNFSRGGHVGQSYQITQWYPKPAVYDKSGWHEIPYLDQGEFNSEFGDFDVKITLPDNYVVAATGELQNEEEKKWLIEKTKMLGLIKGKKNLTNIISSSVTLKTLQYKQANVHDFAWFADKTFIVQKDTLLLNDQRKIDIFSFVLPANIDLWKNSIAYTKRAIQTKSNWIGAYPYNVVSVVDSKSEFGGGMEYPTIRLLTAISEEGLESVINHEVGHNWFYGILGSNERNYPWMDEGMNSYYDKRYDSIYLFKNKPSKGFFATHSPSNLTELLLKAYEKFNLDQPINTSSENFSETNYGLIAYEKASLWMKKLETELGTETFDNVMKAYYEQWKFKHPSVSDFKEIAENTSGKSLGNLFALLDKKGNFEKQEKKQLKFSTIFNLKETEKYNYINISPIIGVNFYDKLMIGAVVHNYSLPPTNFNFLVAPMYATGTKKVNGVARLGYNFFLKGINERLSLDISAVKFTGGSFKDSTNKENPLQFSKIVPSIKYVFGRKNPLSRINKFIQFKSFIISETNILFSRDAVNNKDIITYPIAQRYINQLQFSLENNRVLYPYNAVFQAEQGDGFMRLNITGNYYFNYQKGGGLNLRFFAGKFIYLGDKTFTNQFKTDIYHLNLTGPRGYEDYTYSNYFVGRNEFEGFSSQQLMNRDGFFKVGTDFLSSKVGKSDDWLSAVNITTTIPDKINILNALPIKIPLRLFVDIGTYAEAWKTAAPTGKFLYDAGFQLSLFKNVINIYIPVVYSKVYKDYYKSTITEKKFQRTISFSVDINQLKFSKFFPQANL